MMEFKLFKSSQLTISDSSPKIALKWSQKSIQKNRKSKNHTSKSRKK